MKKIHVYQKINVEINQTYGQLKVTESLEFIQPLKDTNIFNTLNAILTCEVQRITKSKC